MMRTPSAADLNEPADLGTQPFHLFAWPQRLLVTGPSHASGSHRHHAVQVACGLDGPVAYRGPHGELRAELVLIPPDVPHAHDAFGAAAVLCLDAEGDGWARLRGGVDDRPRALAFEPRLRALAREASAGSAHAARAFVDALAPPAAGDAPQDDALVAQVRRLVRERLDGAVTLAALAAAVHRSPSRLAHRFRDATGLPLRRYVLWCRLRVAVERAMRGASLTEAAHAAGFADSAHLSRTFRATFGIAPSFLFERGRLAVTFVED